MTPASVTLSSQCGQRVAADTYGTPLFYYSLSTLRGQIARFRAAMSGYPVRLFFATMANDRAEILHAISAEGVGACVNSVPHLHRALEHGFDVRSVHFTSCGLPIADMIHLQALEIPANLDSPSQVEAWCRLKPGARAGARINAASLAGSPAVPDRIGMDLDAFARARQIARQHDGIVNGVHVYAGTNFQASHDMLLILRGMFELVRRNPDIDYINLGGGIGVDYSHAAEPFDYERFGGEVCSWATEVSRDRGRQIDVIFEPGRSMVASCGVFVSRVTDIKTLRETRFVVIDGSVSVFPRPFHHPGSLHRAQVLDDHKGSEMVLSTVVGRTTFSRDIFGSYALPTSLAVGDYLAFDDAGAYCESMSSRFLGQREPICYVAED